MKKLLTILTLALALLFGGSVAIAAPAVAEGCQIGATCDPNEPEPCPVIGGCQPPCPQIGGCGTVGGGLTYAQEDALEQQVVSAEQTVNDYRARLAAANVKVAALTVKAERLQRTADRRAATIQRLRAKIRALR